MTSAEHPLLLEELILAKLNGDITPEEEAALYNHLQQSQDDRQFYVEYVHLNAMLQRYAIIKAVGASTDITSAKQRSPKQEKLSEDADQIDIAMLDDAAVFRAVIEQDLYDTAAREALEDAKARCAELEKSLLEKAHPVKSRFGRREVFRSMSRIAAIVVVAFLIILLDRQIRHPQEAPEVLARITGMEAAQWANADKTYQVGQDLVSQILNLKAGLVELTFSDGAEVILEAPVEVTINKTEEIFLQKGKVTVTASGTAVGFAVNTDNARVVDLGTEFGVSVNASGVTDIHVYQGEVALIAGWQRNMFNNASKPRINIIKGQARRVAADQSVREIPHNEIAFVRKDDFKIRQKTLAGDPYYRWRAQGLFLADEDTLHLYHFDVGITDVIRTDPIDLTLANGAILANASTVGFITALNTYDGLPSQEGPAAYKNDIPISSFVGADGAFTFEAIIKPTMPLESLTHKMFIIVGDDITGHRGWHFDIALQDNIWQLGFTNIVPSVVKYYTAIPTTGEHVYTAESWYHVAVTYNGRDNTADNLKLYWTRLDSGAATAQELDSFQMAVDLTPAVTTNFCIGNEWRENLGLSYYNFEGLIGAVRISKISRRADNMMFGVSVSPALGAGESGRRYAP